MSFFKKKKGPFASFETRFNRACEWTGLSFSNDGNQILVSTNGGAICILHAFNGSVLHTFSVRDLQWWWRKRDAKGPYYGSRVVWNVSTCLFVYSRVTTTATAYSCRPASLQIPSSSWSVKPLLLPGKGNAGFVNTQTLLDSQGAVCCARRAAAGSEDGRVHVWSTESGMKVAVLDGKHSGPINTLQFNPRYLTFTSACTNMVRSCNIQTSRCDMPPMHKWANDFLLLCFRLFGCRVLMTCRAAVLWCHRFSSMQNDLINWIKVLNCVLYETQTCVFLFCSLVWLSRF